MNTAREPVMFSERQLALPPFTPERRASRVLIHVTSLPSPYGIGDVGPAAFAWVDRLHDAGQGWWQSLPLGPSSSRICRSPKENWATRNERDNIHTGD